MAASERTKTRRLLPEAERKEMILDAALDIFSQFGYERADVDQIAQRAGVGKGTIYRHFESKQSLFLALVDRGYSLLCERMQSIPFGDKSFEARLRAGMRSHVDFFIANPKYYRVLMLELPDHRLKIGVDILRRHQRYTQPLVKAITGAIRSRELQRIDPEFAALCLAAMSCIIVERYLRGQSDTREKDIRSAIDLFLRGVTK
jgi:AcrR family transcriptional regulator